MCCPRGRIFLGHLITLANSVQRPHHRIYLFSGGPPSYLHTTAKPCSPQQSQSSLHLCLLTPQHLVGSACGVLTGCLLTGLWTTPLSTLSTSVVLATCRWAPLWSGYRVVVKSDSQVAAAILNKGSSHCPMIMAWIRHLFWLKEYFNFIIVEHIPGSINTLADSVSRFDDVRHWKEFQAWLSKSSTSRDLKPHMSALTLALLRSKG